MTEPLVRNIHQLSQPSPLPHHTSTSVFRDDDLDDFSSQATTTTATNRERSYQYLRTHPYYKNNYGNHIRQDWDTVDLDNNGSIEYLEANWIELFFDLIVIACISNITEQIIDSFDSSKNSHKFDTRIHFLIIIIFQFSFVSMAWYQFMIFKSQFNFNTNFDKFLQFLAMIPIVGMSYGAHNSISNIQFFLFQFVLFKLIFLFFYFKTISIPRAKKSNLYYIFASVLQIIPVMFICLWAASMNDDDDDDNNDDWFLTQLQTSYQAWIIIYAVVWVYNCVVDMLPWFTIYCASRIAIPLNAPHIAERFNEFTLFMFGETIVACVGMSTSYNL